MSKILIILIAAIITACISGIFGMAGGMIFMGVIASIMDVSEAMVVHGYVQGLSNSSRSYILKADIRWDIVRNVAFGALPAIAVLAFIAFVPAKSMLFFMLGLLPLILWLPKGWLQGDAARPRDAVLCGTMVMGLNLVAGVAGPALDFFFVKTVLTRKEIVSTKAVIMFGSHMVKIGYFGIPLLHANGMGTLPPLWFFGAVIPCVILGTIMGTKILQKLSDIGFKSYTKYLVTCVGLVYLSRGISLLLN